MEIAPEKIARVAIVDEHISTFDKVTLEVVKKESKTLVKVSRKLEPKD